MPVKTKKILFTGGGTAGHILPIIGIVRELRKLEPDNGLKIYFVGPKDKIAADYLKKEGILTRTIWAGKIRRYFAFQNFIDIIFKLPISVIQAFIYVFFISPDLIFSKGGYGSFPVVLSGWLLLTPIFSHESDVEPGLANKLMAKMAIEIFTAFPANKIKKLPAKKLLAVGNPLRAGLLRGSKEEASKIFNLGNGKPIILFLGGSQGSQKINDTLFVILSEILNNFEIIHQTGEKNIGQIKNEAEVFLSEEQKRFYHPAAFLNEEELASAFSCCDLVVSRAGAGSIFEIAAVGKPSILIPLAGAAQNHQVNNAYVYSEAGACQVIEEANLTPLFFLERVKLLFSRPDEMFNMAVKAKEFSKIKSGEIIANYLAEYIKK